MGKSNARAIRGADPLYRADVADPLAACNVCGRPSDELRAYRAHDERDVPLPGPSALGFIGKDHKPCVKKMEAHPRLYGEDTGHPGTFPALCGPCGRRDGIACRHPDLKSNGGPGLLVHLSGGLPPGTIVCPPPRIVRRAEKCAGFERKLSQA